MDVQLQELIDKIKKEGIESASALAERTKEEASEEAKGILQSAKKEADLIREKAASDAERMEKAGIAALEQASRNLVLAFKAELQNLLDTVIAEETAKVLDDGVLKAVLPNILETWVGKEENTLELLLSPEDLSKIEAFFSQKLSSTLKKGVELKTDSTIGAGFRISAKDGNAYYDFSAAAVAELLSSYLNPRLEKILKNAVEGM